MKYFRIKKAVMAFLFFCTTCVFAQNAVVKGTVFNGNQQEKLLGAVVKIAELKTIATATDIDGNFLLNVYAGNYHLVITSIGFANDTAAITLKAGDTLIVKKHLKSKDKLLNMVVVSAGKFDQKIEELTVSMEVIKADLISKKNTNSIEQVIEQAPGVTILDNDPQIRGGSGFTFGVGSRVAIVVDGMPLLTGDAGRPEWNFIPTENVEQIEIIKGASSVLYGSAALSGVINVRTAYPREIPKTVVTVNGGMYNLQNKNMDWYGKNSLPIYGGVSFLHSRIIKKNFDFVIGGNYFADASYMGPPHPDSLVVDTITNFTNKDIFKQRFRINFDTRYRFKKIEGLSAGINGNGMTSKSNFVLAWQDDSLNIYRAYPGAISLQQQNIFNVDPFINYNTKRFGTHSLKTRLFYSDNVITNNQSNQSTQYYAEYQFQEKFQRIKNLVFTGGLVSNISVSHSKLYSGTGFPNHNIRNYSAYAQVDYKIKDIINISGGYRYEYFLLDSFQKAHSPILRGGINIRATKATWVRASYGEGFRFPTITERFILTNVGYFGVFPNPKLEPEKSTNIEFGIKQGFRLFGFKGFLDVAFFQQNYHNTIEYLFGIWNKKVTPFGFKFLNTGDSRVRGYDISLMGKTDENKKVQFTIHAGYTYVNPISLNPHYVFAKDDSREPQPLSYTKTSIDTNGYVLKYRFKHLIKSDEELKFKRWSIGHSIRYYSGVQNIDTAFSQLEIITAFVPYIQDMKVLKFWKKGKNGTFVNDFRLSYILDSKQKISIVISNAFNKVYSLRPMKIESPRTFAIQYRLEF